jgi:hypothetical protein
VGESGLRNGGELFVYEVIDEREGLEFGLGGLGVLNHRPSRLKPGLRTSLLPDFKSEFEFLVLEKFAPIEE